MVAAAAAGQVQFNQVDLVVVVDIIQIQAVLVVDKLEHQHLHQLRKDMTVVGNQHLLRYLVLVVVAVPVVLVVQDPLAQLVLVV